MRSHVVRCPRCSRLSEVLPGDRGTYYYCECAGWNRLTLMEPAPDASLIDAALDEILYGAGRVEI